MIVSHKRRTDDFEAAAMPHVNDLYRTAMRLLGDAARADDVVQDVYLHAWQSFEDFALGTNCRAWLFKILFHKLRHYRRKWMSLRIVKDSEEILEHAESHGPSGSRRRESQTLVRVSRRPMLARLQLWKLCAASWTIKPAKGSSSAEYCGET